MPLSVRAAALSALSATIVLTACSGPGSTRPDIGATTTAMPDLPSTPTPSDVEARPPRRSVPARPAGDLLIALEDDGSLMAGLASGDARTRWLAARALGQLDAAGAASVLAQRSASERDPEVLAMMLWSLGQSGQRNVANVFLPMLSHGDARVRAAAVEGLGKTHDDSHTMRVVSLLEDPDPSVRGAAALALFRFDGRRYDHGRRASSAVRAARDEALVGLLVQDPDEGVRWRAAYALAHVPVNGTGMNTALQLALQSPTRELRIFTLLTLGQIAADGHVNQPDVDAWLNDDDVAVATAAAGALGEYAPSSRLASIALEHRHAQVRHRAAMALATRADPQTPYRAGMADGRDASLAALGTIIERAPGGAVERTALTAMAKIGSPVGLERLATSSDVLHREAAAQLLADDEAGVTNDALLVALARDASSRVRAAAYAGLTNPDLLDGALQAGLADALRSRDPALVAGAAKAAAAHSAKGRAHPDVMLAIADAVALTDVDASFVEARADVRAAMGLEPATTPPGAPPVDGVRLLDRLVALDAEAQADPHPTVRVSTGEGSFTIRLDRVAAPIHVASFLEQARRGDYDGTTFHRVVPGFVAQGLDPLGHGWGTNGRRLPDEFGATPYVTGTVGMPNSGNPHSGGCQLFVSHVPTPHLDGRYTVFGEVVSGMDVVQRLEIGDRVSSVR